jgi:hypothetical protein
VLSPNSPPPERGKMRGDSTGCCIAYQGPGLPSVSHARTLEFTRLPWGAPCCPSTVTGTNLFVLGLRHTLSNPQPYWPLVCGPVFAFLGIMIRTFQTL